MKSNQNDPNILNDLIKINNDRIEGYKLAVDLANEQGEGARRLFLTSSLRSLKNLLLNSVRWLSLPVNTPRIGRN